MQRIKFIDRMAQGKISRRDMLTRASTFGVAMMTLPVLPKAAEVLTCLEWAGYDDPSYFKSFADKNGAPNFSIFTGEEDALAKVLAGFSADVMHPCNYSVNRFVNAKVAAEIDVSKLSNWKDVFPALQTADGVVMDGKVMMAPADWGNASIAYRPDLVDEDFKKNESWQIFYDDKYAGKVAMLDNELCITFGLMFEGMSYKEAAWASGDKLKAAAEKWGKKCVANSRFLWTDPTEMTQALASGEIVAAYAWNDTIKNLTDQGIPVAYARPKEGYFTWYCGLTLLNSGKADKSLAYDFIDAWLSPETGKTLIEGSGLGHANVKSFAAADQAAVAKMGFTDPVQHMKDGVLFTQVPDAVQNENNKLWGDIKALKQ
jgi:spermidine/putrescine transport system substrate-binding protein